MNLTDDTQTLLNLGLTASQAKVYLALLKLGVDSKGTTIAKFAGVPRQDVYRLLAELQQVGIVQKKLARPATFRSARPEQAVSILLERKISNFSELKREADDFVNSIKEGLGVEQLVPTEFDQFILISEREAITCKARDLLEKTQKTANHIMPFNELVPWLTVLSKSIDEVLNRGVEIKWITEKPANTSLISKFLKTYTERKNFKLRFLPKPVSAKMAIHDSKQVVLALFAYSSFARSPALWSNNTSFATIAESYFETCWKSAMELKGLRNII
jgi:sugar-specific transcriptional regulator TrmB